MICDDTTLMMMMITMSCYYSTAFVTRVEQKEREMLGDRSIYLWSIDTAETKVDNYFAQRWVRLRFFRVKSSKMKYNISLVIITISLFSLSTLVNGATLNQYSGVVEGYYWPTGDTIRGHLNFDDAEGVTTTEQQTLEKNMVASLASAYPSTSLWGLTPAYYYQETTRANWNKSLETIDAVSSTIPFVFTGEKITESTFSPAKFPNLKSNRPLVVWDNWIAEDTSTRLAWGMIDQRISNNMFTAPYGYILNLGYPLERVIHHIYCLGVISKVSSNNQPMPSCNVTQSAAYWSQWLSDNGFLHNNQTVVSVTTGLAQAINNDQFFDTIALFEQANPSVAGIFSLPPNPPIHHPHPLHQMVKEVNQAMQSFYRHH
ncbi:hypothetical protein DFA_05312 [Cavenderia fasciculata]|uniref:Uncharacterized protein n=1 Tax=Cavenderia fasciculata TaxID=261658 RepID=F4PNX7_CACFS|nr:uncharacterized protein DFA_05312 [Cavenderia fasciculata]EGG23180.1 hypothetical protein DFA_05312 [Cavenderia fasciculata]|eukprot:XP_004361031.1 hypothetical protein DFA_05312 [Cavenderia fasciculata]